MKRKPPTKVELARLAAVKRLPCLACTKRGMRHYQCGITEGHHLLSGGRRRGHIFTIPLAAWHHRGVVLFGWNREQMERTFGPSLANGSKPFHECFGDNDSLLAETNRLLDEMHC